MFKQLMFTTLCSHFLASYAMKRVKIDFEVAKL